MQEFLGLITFLDTILANLITLKAVALLTTFVLVLLDETFRCWTIGIGRKIVFHL